MRKLRHHLAYETPASPEIKGEKYDAFNAIDGSHPWQEAVPSAYLLYPTRIIPNGKVLYFNFDLAKEMGLLAENHPSELNSALEKKIVETFSLQIINEYDQQHGRQFPKATLKEKPYMATRYLQLQHENKKGMTSGDGRSIWNGTVKHKGRTWDISSRGTGVTALAPGSVEAQRPIRSGDVTFGYGCGMADVDELLSCAMMSEVFHRMGIPTERTLAVIEIGKNLAIGVRASPNLIRPAHIFLHLKQNNYRMLKAAMDFFLTRQVENKTWQFSTRSPHRYDMMLREIARSYAEFAAILEREYVFCWLDWDGDNCLADAAILDYGSIRIFGLRHDQYRYDDVDRYSTNLNEQRNKARLIVQVFAQAVDFLKTGKRKSLGKFRNHTSCQLFDEIFERELRMRLLKQAGFNDDQAEKLLNEKSNLVKKFEKYFYYFEKMKTQKKTEKLPDGVNRSAVFNMRQFLRELPLMMLQLDGSAEEAELYFSLMQSESASSRDQKFRTQHRYRLQQLLKFYKMLVQQSSSKPLNSALAQMAERAHLNCRPHRLTGNGVEHIVWELLKFRKRGGSFSELQEIVDAFIAEQTVAPAIFAEKYKLWNDAVSLKDPLKAKYKLFKTMMNLITSFEEDI